MEFGNWQVTDTTIEWKGGGLSRFVIPLNELNAIRQNNADDTTFYEWILLATEEDWLTQNDLFDLNYAFVYGIAKAGLDFRYDIFDATLEEQFDQFDIEDNEDFEL
ncbi:MAG: hypothetical protein JWR18_3569 [Segetibacter sp.]|jgi:hypothetical protein|nr:hypothetical protein [Segetibacter sp.]